MTLQEFSERTRLTPTSEEYNLIEKMYLKADNMDKDEFCKDFKKHSQSTILATFYKKALHLKAECDNFRKQQLETAELLIGKAHALNDTDLRNHAVKLVGEKQVVLMILNLGLPLWDEDKEYIKANIR
ncbi:hypothetical protein [Bacteroides cellulosilyticus]|uniref:hypothetical protein n=1 Tax=Bacteroides cellulosilyticus TaxID=246787 RepID=UPI0022E54E62|nr:hypothetical protein [Bacteroides cellulosilyticus]